MPTKNPDDMTDEELLAELGYPLGRQRTAAQVYRDAGKVLGRAKKRDQAPAAKPGLPTITRTQYEALHSDFRGVWSGMSGSPELIGRRTAMSGAIGLPLGFLAIEGISFEIKG